LSLFPAIYNLIRRSFAPETRITLSSSHPAFFTFFTCTEESMDKTPLYQQIAESIRQQIMYGSLGPGDELPTIREMAEQWGCAPGTAQRAYNDLTRQGLVVSRPGAGTHVAPLKPAEAVNTPLRRATLVNQAESFLLSMLGAGYTAGEVEQALGFALDRWRAAADQPVEPPEGVLRFVGSHDPAVVLLAGVVADQAPSFALSLTFAGSLGGLIALTRREADIAGCHLWDAETNTYNRPFVRRLLPGRRIALLTLADRRLGIITAPGNPLGIDGLAALAQPGLRFVNRQPGAGTRVWLDAHLRSAGVEPEALDGYEDEMRTHFEVASAIAEGRADAGLGIEAAALAFGLDFVPLTRERYDLVIPQEVWGAPGARAIAAALDTDDFKAAITNLGGYDTAHTGELVWIG
jgi:molybdate-binding protein/DNA-binding transcriptional regulator YhcF (GntR family)